MPNPSPEAIEEALNALMVARPIKYGPSVKKSVGGLMEVWEPATLQPTEADVYKLAAQLDVFQKRYGGIICSCSGNTTHWHPQREKSYVSESGLPVEIQ